MKTFISLVAPVLLLTASCREPVATLRLAPVSNDEAVETAKKAAQDAFGLLSAELVAAIEKGGTASAISVCSKKAPEIIASMAEKHGIKMERRSDRPRNPGNTADADDQEVIGFFRKQITGGNAPPANCREEADQSILVRLPIVLNNPLCLKCHGSSAEIDRETRAVLSELYPADRATGYKLNDLRGIWRIGVPPKPVP